ncbi:MAG: hypothetical protein EPO31_06895 [Gammaproteobacteria bacterium]|nr:MAG: hypothetical protein EPO31_06895 [Gammaproteobacteria bacterium]
MNTEKRWQITENTPLALILAPNDLMEKIDYLRYVDALLSVAPKSDSLEALYRHNLYESWVVFLWSYLEFLTGQVCDEITVLLNQEIKYCDIRAGSIFESVSKYLKLIGRETFPSEKMKSRLDVYRRIRNMCVHSSGRRIETDFNIAGQQSVKMIKHGGGFKTVSRAQRSALEQVPGITQYKGTYSLSIDFCNAMIGFSVDYVLEFQVVANKIGRRKALFANAKRD